MYKINFNVIKIKNGKLKKLTNKDEPKYYTNTFVFHILISIKLLVRIRVQGNLRSVKSISNRIVMFKIIMFTTEKQYLIKRLMTIYFY